MQDHFSISSSLKVGPLHEDNLSAYNNFCEKLPDPDRYRKYQDNEGASLFGENSNKQMFCLWLDDEIIGQSMIAFDPDSPDDLAVFCETEILPEHHGKGYARHLHDVRKDYLERIGFAGKIETHIKPDNLPSLRAAIKSGFTDTGDSHKGFSILTL